MNNSAIGSSFERFLEEEDILGHPAYRLGLPAYCPLTERQGDNNFLQYT
jgi:hypothetical protein